jgi:hypothetical protein
MHSIVRATCQLWVKVRFLNILGKAQPVAVAPESLNFVINSPHQFTWTRLVRFTKGCAVPNPTYNGEWASSVVVHAYQPDFPSIVTHESQEPNFGVEPVGL